MSLDLDPNDIFRDFTTDGIPASGAHDPRKVEIRQHLSALRQSVIALLAGADPNLALPNLLIRATDAGAGTPNAIQAATNLPVPAADASALIALNVFRTNTGSPVTVSLNGGPGLTIKTNTGNDVVAGGLIEGMMVLGVKTGSVFRLFSDQSSAALLAAVEDAADRAEAAAAGVEYPVSYAPQVLTDEQKAQARDNIGVGGGATFGIDPRDFGAAYDGVTDDREALARADAAATAAGKSLMITGPLRIGSPMTITSNQFYAPPGRLIPTSNVLVTLLGRPDAGHWQIFDRSNGGAIHFARGAGEVWAEWWGACAQPNGRTDNEVPIQHAIDACGSVLSAGDMGPAPNGDGNGGTVRFASNNSYLVSGGIHLRNRTILRGNGGYTEIKLNRATWSGTEMVLSRNGNLSQFWCILERMIINADGLEALNRMIYAPAWQESCGLRDVLLRNFYNTALLVDTFYGGSVGITLKQVQFFPWAAPGNFVRAIDIDSPATVARQRILLEDISFAGITDSAPPGLNAVGIRARGRVDIIGRGVFVEGYDIGCLLRGQASLYGDFTGPGNPSVEDLIEADSDFTGRIDCIVSKGSAVRLLRSFKPNPSTLQLNGQPYNRRVVYPVTPSEVFAAGRMSGGAGTPTVATSYGISSVSKQGAGLYTLTFDTTEFNPGTGSDYRVRIAVQSVNARTWYVSAANSTGVQIQFKNATTDAAADVGDFDFEIYGRPGF